METDGLAYGQNRKNIEMRSDVTDGAGFSYDADCVKTFHRFVKESPCYRPVPTRPQYAAQETVASDVVAMLGTSAPGDSWSVRKTSETLLKG